MPREREGERGSGLDPLSLDALSLSQPLWREPGGPRECDQLVGVPPRVVFGFPPFCGYKPVQSHSGHPTRGCRMTGVTLHGVESREPSAPAPTQEITGNTFEAGLDPFLHLALKTGHVTPGYPGKTYPVAFWAEADLRIPAASGHAAQAVSERVRA